jgi:hypothetical protein
MVFRLPLLLLLFSALTFRSLAQVYEPGWLVRSNGDTLRGEIENNFWREAPTFVKFRPTATAASQQFQPRQLRAFGLRGGRYFRREPLPIDYAADTRTGSLPERTTTAIRSDSVLAEVLVDGAATLWRVALPGSTHFLLRVPGRPALDMSERKYQQRTPDGGWAIVDGNNYRDLLPIYVGSCPVASKVAEQARFTAQALAAVAETYNTQCGGGAQASQRYLSAASESRRVAFVGGVLAGARYNHFTENAYPGTRCVDCQTHPFGGLYAELLLPNRQTAVYGELSASTFRSNHLFTTPGNVGDYRGWVSTARVGMRFFLQLSPQQQLLLGLGYELNRILQAERLLNGQPNGKLATDFLEFQSTTLVPNLTLGWRRQRLTATLDGQLYRRDDTSATSALLGTDYSLRLGLACRLGRHPDAARP